jgi:hypothetical protein
VYQWCGFKSRRGKNKNLTALKSNSNTVWFNFQTYIYIYRSLLDSYLYSLNSSHKLKAALLLDIYHCMEFRILFWQVCCHLLWHARSHCPYIHIWFLPQYVCCHLFIWTHNYYMRNKYISKCHRHVSRRIFIRYGHSQQTGKPNKLEVFGSKYIKGPMTISIVLIFQQLVSQMYKM